MKSILAAIKLWIEAIKKCIFHTAKNKNHAFTSPTELHLHKLI